MTILLINEVSSVVYQRSKVLGRPSRSLYYGRLIHKATGRSGECTVCKIGPNKTERLRHLLLT